MPAKDLFKKIEVQISAWQAALGLILTVSGVVMATFNFAIAYKLYPLWQAVNETQSRVDAIEADRATVPEWRERIAIMEKRVEILEKSLDAMGADVSDIRNYLLP